MTVIDIFTFDRIIAFLMSIIFLILVWRTLNKSKIKSQNNYDDYSQTKNLTLNNWLEEVEKIEHEATNDLMKVSAKLEKLCDLAKAIIPPEFQDHFPSTWDGTDEIARKFNIRYKSPDNNLYYGHSLLKTEIIKKLVEDAIKKECKKLRAKESN